MEIKKYFVAAWVIGFYLLQLQIEGYPPASGLRNFNFNFPTSSIPVEKYQQWGANFQN